MGQALYRSHRPKKLSEVVGQEHITTALDRALKKGVINHAYLLTGPRGVGKTSVARILAHEVNNIPYDDERLNLDIIEIDAASNRRIDEIRDLRDKVHITPSSAKYKVYIIDEVHMLTKEAFNALLKTLEEPPAHAIFILATTEAHKLPETIVSRTQRYTFKPIAQARVVEHLKKLAAAEGLRIEDQALELIAAHGDGSFRDSIGLLDQMRSSVGLVALADVQSMLGIAPKELVSALLKAVANQDIAAILSNLAAAHSSGYEPARLAKQLGASLRDQLLGGDSILPTRVLLSLLNDLLEVPSSSDPRGRLEIALLDVAFESTLPAATSIKSPPTKFDQITGQTATSNKSKTIDSTPQARHADPKQPTLLNAQTWTKVLEALKKQHNTLYGIVQASTPQFGSGTVTLITSYGFHQKRLSDKVSQKTLLQVVEAATGQHVQIHVVFSPSPAKVASPEPPSDTELHASPRALEKNGDAIKAISNIFGSAELLES